MENKKTFYERLRNVLQRTRLTLGKNINYTSNYASTKDAVLNDNYSDREAIKKDWQAVGNDMKIAMGKFKTIKE